MCCVGGVDPGEAGGAAGDVGGGDLMDGVVHHHFKVEAFTIVVGVGGGGGNKGDISVANASIVGDSIVCSDVKGTVSQVVVAFDGDSASVGRIEVVVGIAVGEGGLKPPLS